jgi:trehalose 6-phosphate synthase
LLVNSLLDGMNLVSKEGPVVNERHGVLVLSETAGSHEELAGAALSVKPNDIAGTASALDRALRMDASERTLRAQVMRETIERHQIRDWLRLLTKDLTIIEYVRALAPAS